MLLEKQSERRDLKEVCFIQRRVSACLVAGSVGLRTMRLTAVNETSHSTGGYGVAHCRRRISNTQICRHIPVEVLFSRAGKMAQFGWVFLEMAENVLALLLPVAKALSCALNCRVGRAK